MVPIMAANYSILNRLFSLIANDIRIFRDGYERGTCGRQRKGTATFVRISHDSLLLLTTKEADIFKEKEALKLL